MDSSDITAKSGIWRASYRRTLADAIVSCREEEALDAAQHLSRLGLETLTHDLRRVRDEVLADLGPHQTPDALLRSAVMRTVMEVVTTQVQDVFKVEAGELAPVV